MLGCTDSVLIRSAHFCKGTAVDSHHYSIPIVLGVIQHTDAVKAGGGKNSRSGFFCLCTYVLAVVP